MPIFPRYQISDRELPTVSIPVLPADTTTSSLFQGLGEVGRNLSNTFGDLAERQQKLQDATDVAKRTMQAELDIDDTLERIRANRDAHANAPQRYQEQINAIGSRWTDGLRAEQAATLMKALTPRLIEGQKTARAMRNKYQIDEATATLDVAEQSILDSAARLDRTDDEAFRGLYSIGTHPETGARIRAPGAYPTYLETLVSTNLIDKAKATTRLQKTASEAAYGRLQRMTVSENPEIAQRAIDVLNKEDDERGSTFAFDIEAKHRNELRKTAQGQLHTLMVRAREDDDRERTALERNIKITQEAVERSFNDRFDRGELTKDAVSVAVNAGVLSPAKQELFYKMIDARALEGRDDPGTARTLTDLAYDIKQNPAKVQADVESAFMRGKLALQTMRELKAHLQTWQQHDADQARSDNKELAKARHGQTEQIMRTVLVFGESSVLKQLAEPTLGIALRDLADNSIAMRPGGKDPLAWWDANKNAYLSVVGASGSLYATQQRKLLPPSLKDIKHADELKADATFMALPRERQIDVYQSVKDLLDLESALKRMQSQSGGSGGAAGNTKGEAQGPKPARSAPPPVGKR